MNPHPQESAHASQPRLGPSSPNIRAAGRVWSREDGSVSHRLAVRRSGAGLLRAGCCPAGAVDGGATAVLAGKRSSFPASDRADPAGQDDGGGSVGSPGARVAARGGRTPAAGSVRVAGMVGIRSGGARGLPGGRRSVVRGAGRAAVGPGGKPLADDRRPAESGALQTVCRDDGGAAKATGRGRELEQPGGAVVPPGQVRRGAGSGPQSGGGSQGRTGGEALHLCRGRVQPGDAPPGDGRAQAGVAPLAAGRSRSTRRCWAKSTPFTPTP